MAPTTLRLNLLLQAPEARRAVGQQLHAACRDVGFFYIVGHGMPPEVQEGVLAQARRWFELPVRTAPNCPSGCCASHHRSPAVSVVPQRPRVVRFVEGLYQGKKTGAAFFWDLMQEAAKRQIALSPGTHYRGYQQLGANVTRYEGGFQRDWHEVGSAQHAQGAQHAQHVRRCARRRQSRWPCMAGCHSVVQCVLSHMGTRTSGSGAD